MKSTQAELPPGCPSCRGAPWVMVREGCGAGRCTCARGIALAALDRAKREKRRGVEKRSKRVAHDGRAAAAGVDA